MIIEAEHQYFARGGKITHCPTAYAAEAYTEQHGPLAQEDAKQLSEYYNKMEEHWHKRQALFYARVSPIGERKMSLEQMRLAFTANVTKFLTWCEVNNYSIAIDQVKRTQAEADLNAASGAGISNSLHLLGLAIDLLLYDKNGNYLTDKASYQPLGDYWKTLDPLNRWGGDFTTHIDSDHFSMTYNGIE